jgi:hypothetical protein
MASKSKSKGSSWEREIAKFLTELYDESFLRVPNSGAYIGGSNTFRKAQLDEGQVNRFKSDIVAPSSWRRFNCEAKNYNDFPFHQLFTGEIKQLETWLSQLMETADEGDCNLLCIKITRKATLVAFETTRNFLASDAFLYKSTTHGSWYIMDFNKFWASNKLQVKSFCN